MKDIEEVEKASAPPTAAYDPNVDKIVPPQDLLEYIRSIPAADRPQTNCTEDCSGHSAGYDWAEENEINDPDDCGGNSSSFVAGCEEFAEQQQSAMQKELEYPEDTY